jgi:hypothetical protein
MCKLRVRGGKFETVDKCTTVQYGWNLHCPRTTAAATAQTCTVA